MTHPTPLKFLMPGWFALVMGYSGWSLAWHRASPFFGEAAGVVAAVLGLLAALLLVVLLVASVLRAWRYPEALLEDLKHPVRHAFVAAAPVGVMLVATVGVALMGPSAGLEALWWVGSVGQLVATWWVLGRWLAPVPAPALGAPPVVMWPSITPVLFIPVVGNVVAPLAGVGLGHEVWSAMQMAIGVFFWPVVMALLVARRVGHSPLPDRIVPSWFIGLAPPSVIGLSLMQWDVALVWVQAVWGIAAFVLMWLLPLFKRILAQPFAVPFWALSFPLAAFTSLTLRLAQAMAGQAGAALMQGLAVLLLAVTSVLLVWLSLSTVRGLRNGSMLAPEIHPTP
ncbi:MAG: Tellurite resistance protein TehA [Pseudomonadota bacterium]